MGKYCKNAWVFFFALSASSVALADGARPVLQLSPPTLEPSIPTLVKPTGQDKPCVISGCSGQVCSDAHVTTICLWRDEYECYATASCERISGQCGWKMTPELQACIERRAVTPN